MQSNKLLQIWKKPGISTLKANQQINIQKKKEERKKKGRKKGGGGEKTTKRPRKEIRK